MMHETTRAVLDWDGRPVGQVQALVVDPRTRQPRSVLVRLHPEARADLRAEALTIAVPYRHVAGVRRDELLLAHRLRDLALLRLPPA